MQGKSPNTELPNTPCRFSSQKPGFTIYISGEIADAVLKAMPLKKKFLAVFDEDAETLTIQKFKIQS